MYCPEAIVRSRKRQRRLYATEIDPEATLVSGRYRAANLAVLLSTGMGNNIEKLLVDVRMPHAETRQRLVLTAVISILTSYAPFASGDAVKPPKDNSGQSDVPAWVFPMNAIAPSTPPPYDNVRPLRVPNSTMTFTEAELNDLFSAPDWRPTSHGAMPPIVAHGHPPDVYACGYCHTAGGQGRPENASLAGLPAAYIMNQVADFKSGARKSAWRGPYRPADRMIYAVTHATEEELSVAAEYFAAQSLQPRVVVVERERVPRSRVVGWVYAEKSGGDEPLGQRLLEFAPDVAGHENRDDEMRYIAYVPPGSIGRGEHIAQTGSDSPANACTSCHGLKLRGVGPIPPIAGRSPTYILRQLLGFKTGARSGTTGLPMRAVVKNLKISDMIDVAAYAASLPLEP
jgi:cytochrome c553